MNSVDIYDIPSDSWSEGISGGQARSGHSQVNHDGVHYLWGGRGSSQSFFNTLDSYNPGISQNHAPVVTRIQLADPPLGSRYRDLVPLSFDTEDEDGDSVTVAFEYSLDGGQIWKFIDSHHFTKGTQNLPSGTSVNLAWNSYSDITDDQSSVLLRFTPTDSEVRGQAVETQSALALNNAGTWEATTQGLSARSHHPMVAVDGVADAASRLVVWGGFDENRAFLDSLNFYDLEQNTWSQGSPGPLPGAGRAEHTAVVYADRVYFWGGRDSSGFLNSFAIYKYDTDAWRPDQGGSGGTARALHTAVEFQGRMLVWGGKGTTG